MNFEFSNIKIENENSRSFVGITFNDSQIIVHKPYAFEISTNNKNDFIDDIRILLLSIQKACTQKEILNNVNSFGENQGYFPILSFIWILDFYKKNNRPVVFERHYSSISSGKINWKRSIQGSMSIINNNVYYNDLVYESKRTVNNLFIEVYYFCIYQAISKYGCWALGMSVKSLPNYSYKFNKLVKSNYLNCIERESRNTFNDDFRLLLDHMKNIVNCTIGDNGSVSTFGITTFNKVFEDAIDYVYNNINHNEDFYPTAKYNFGGKEMSKLVPDTIHIANNKAYIIDAKCYSPGSLPDTSSIHKQITYAENLEFKHKNLSKKYLSYSKNHIYNSFIFPGSLQENQLFEFVGIATSSWKDCSKAYETIRCIKIDLKKILYTYVFSNKNLYNWLPEFYKLF